MSPDLHGKNIIGGKLSAENSETFAATNPATGAALAPRFHTATTREVDAAVTAANAAFREYRRVAPDERAAFLERIADEIMALGDALIQRADAETALGEARLTGERLRTANQLRIFAALVREGSWVGARIDRALPDRKPLPRPDLRRMLIAIGPVAVFGASNFPLALSTAGSDTASALASGNPVIVKAHPSHPGTSELMAGAIVRAATSSRLPDGVFSMLHGGAEAGLALVRHPLLEAVGFTGSTGAGRALFDAAAARERPIPVYAEMGSINPVFVLPGALRERGAAIADGLTQSVTLGVGQFCTNPGLVVGLKGADLDAFVAGAAEKISAAPPASMLNAGICASFARGAARLASSPGVSVAGRSSGQPESARAEGAPTIFTTDARTFLKDASLAEEVFGPATLTVACGSREELESVARGLEGQLTATIHGTPDDLEEFRELISILEMKVGRLLFNGFPTGVEVCAAMQHGGPYPATSDSRCTSIGTAAIERFVRPICYQDFPEALLPSELRDANERGIWRLVDNEWTRGPIARERA
jgi:2,5-dioxopentanoate dehydrogenase